MPTKDGPTHLNLQGECAPTPRPIASDVLSLCIVITCVCVCLSACAPGVLYQLPYDVEGLLCHDDHMLGVRLIHTQM
jgi:hypothetical protein